MQFKYFYLKSDNFWLAFLAGDFDNAGQMAGGRRKTGSRPEKQI